MFHLLEKAKQRDSQEKSEKKQIGLKFIVDGWTILVGRSSKENDALLRHHACGKGADSCRVPAVHRQQDSFRETIG